MSMSNQTIAEFLRQIPQSNQPKQTICQLYESSQNDDYQTLFGIIKMLEILGIVTLESADSAGNSLIQASSQTAKYALMSIADYIEREEPIITDWETRGIQSNILGNGATFLQALEQERFKRFDTITPSRYVKAAQVFIKRINPETGKHELLFQFDENANQYQLIGGRWSEKDGDDIKVTIIREIEEELPLNNIPYPDTYQLALLLDNFTVEGTISSTFGALTNYTFWLYHMTNLKIDLQLQPEDKWIPVDMILNGVVIEDGQEFPFANPNIFQRINQALPNGLAGLPVSYNNS